MDLPRGAGDKESPPPLSYPSPFVVKTSPLVLGLALAIIITSPARSAEPGLDGLPFGAKEKAIEKQFPNALWHEPETAYFVKGYPLQTGTSADQLTWNAMLSCKERRFVRAQLTHKAAPGQKLEPVTDSLRAAFTKLYGAPFFDERTGRLPRTVWEKDGLLVSLGTDHEADTNQSLLHLIYMPTDVPVPGPKWNGVPFGSSGFELRLRYPTAKVRDNKKDLFVPGYELKSGTSADQLTWALLLSLKDEGLAQVIIGHDDTKSDLLAEAAALRAALSKTYPKALEDNKTDTQHKTRWWKDDVLLTMLWERKGPSKTSLLLIYQPLAPEK